MYEFKTGNVAVLEPPPVAAVVQAPPASPHGPAEAMEGPAVPARPTYRDIKAKCAALGVDALTAAEVDILLPAAVCNKCVRWAGDHCRVPGMNQQYADFGKGGQPGLRPLVAVRWSLCPPDELHWCCYYSEDHVPQDAA